MGKFKITFLFEALRAGIFSPVTLSKFVFEENNSVSALIKFALAPAREDLDEQDQLKLFRLFVILRYQTRLVSRIDSHLSY